jgi:hypothetical protein
MRARMVAYVRASTDAACASAAEQRAAIEAWASREGVEIAAWHEDRGEDIGERPGLAAAIEFFNTSFGGGFGARCADTGEPRDSHACVIRGVRCRADEARFGGIVIEAVGETA